MPPVPHATELGASLIVLAIAVAFEPSLRGPVVFTHVDDQDNFVQHPLIAAVAADGLSARVLCAVWLPQYVVLGVWEPVATLFKIALARWYGLGSALPFVRASVALHCANCVAAYVVGCRVLALLRLRGVTGLPRPLGEDHRPVCLAALLLGISPMCVEPVAWASGQPYVLAGGFSLLHVLLHLRRHHPTLDERERGASTPAEALVLLAYAAAVLSKAAALTAFAVPAGIDLLVWLHGPGRRLRLVDGARGRSAVEAAKAGARGPNGARAQGEQDGEWTDDDDDDEIDDDDDDERAEEEEEDELTPAALARRAARRPRWVIEQGGADETLLLEAAEHVLDRHWRALFACVCGTVVAVCATSGMHGRRLAMLERVMRACHMLTAYPLCALLPAAHTSVRLHLPARIEPLSARFGLPTLLVLGAVKAVTYAVTWYGSAIRQHVLEARKALLAARQSAHDTAALPVVVLPPPYAFLTHAIGWLCYCTLLLPVLGLLGWGRAGSHIVMVRADRYAYLPSLLLGVPALSALLCLLARAVPPLHRPSAAECQARAIVAARARSLALLSAELRALGVEHDGLVARLRGLGKHLPPCRATLPAGCGAGARTGAGAAHAAGTAADASVPAAADSQVAVAAATLAAGSAAPTAAAWHAPAAAAPAAAAPAAAMPSTAASAPPSSAPPHLLARSRQVWRRSVPLLLLALWCGLRVRETRRLCAVWAAPAALYAHLVELDPTDAPMLEALGAVVMESAEPAAHARAEALFHEALAIAPESAGAHNQLGLLLKRAGKVGEAEGHFQAAIELAPRDGSAYVNLGNLFLDGQRDLGRAADLLSTAVQLLPRNAPALNSLAVALKGLGRLDEARAMYERAIELRPASAPFRYNLGLLHMQIGFDTSRPLPEAQSARASAKEAFEAALRIQPTHLGAQQNLASLIARTRPPRR